MKSLPLIASIIVTCLFLTACNKKDDTEILPGITKEMMPEVPPEMPPAYDQAKDEERKLRHYCINVKAFGLPDEEGKCTDFDYSKQSK